ncbi:primosomal protein N' [Actinokineospora baliensis]|uniref:hypothetical protein n=1 Tax=Actinokineospora baliensis TaxID=547056 RepID=UPI00195B2343|nr:hypothetical protein [Actinokineospora baliensis]MBM7771095.1 primosomal protein N' [Actinokineospora baliensis]
MTRKAPVPGDRVRVPFGFTELAGMVLRTSLGRNGLTVTVAVDVEGADRPIVNNYPLAEVKAPSAA